MKSNEAFETNRTGTAKLLKSGNGRRPEPLNFEKPVPAKLKKYVAKGCLSRGNYN